MATFVMQTLGCEVAGINTVQFSKFRFMDSAERSGTIAARVISGFYVLEDLFTGCCGGGGAATTAKIILCCLQETSWLSISLSKNLF